MKRWERIEENLTGIFWLFGITLFLVLTIYSAVFTGINNTLDDEHISYIMDSLLFDGLGLIGWGLLAYIFYVLTRRFPVRKAIIMNVTAFLVSMMIGMICIWWVGAVNTAPQADQAFICECASAFNYGDFTALEKGGYASIYRQQLGMITLLRVLFLIFGDGNYRAFQYLSAVLAGFLVFFGYQVIKELTQNQSLSEIIYLILMSVCIPLYVYVPFVYGDLISCVFIFLSAWMLLSCLRRFSPGKALVLGISSGIAVQLRENMLIIVIAFLIVLLIKIIARRDRMIVILACSLLLGIFVFSRIVNGIYADKIPEDSKPMPALLHIAMGTNWEGANPGWSNLYNLNTFREYDCNVEASSAAAKTKIAEFFQKCVNDPEYASNFCIYKMLAQWDAPMYQCRVMNNYTVGEQHQIVVSLYSGKLGDSAESFMNVYQLLIYGMVCFLMITRRKEWRNIENYVLLIAVLGGFLFSMIWEAKTRYILPYFLCMIIYAAVGIGSLPFERLSLKLFGRKMRDT